MKHAREEPTLSLSEARSRISPLIRQLSAGASAGVVGIRVRGQIKAYLVSARRWAATDRGRRASTSSRGRLRGTVVLAGDLEAGSVAARETLAALARRSARKLERG